MGDTQASCRNNEHCPGWNPQTRRGTETTQPLCDPCLDRAGHDIRSLVYDYLDLAQLHEPAMSQAINEKSGGSKEPPLPISGHVEALQAEIVHVTGTWENELRANLHLNRGHLLPIPAWATTTSHPLPEVKLRNGAAVQRATNLITPRLRRLAALPACTVRPAGTEDDPADLEGWEAVQHLAALHSRARGILGRTTRRFWIPGCCWNCDAYPQDGEDGPLYRSEPRYPEDPMQVHCNECYSWRPYADYETFMTMLDWPALPETEAAA